MFGGMLVIRFSGLHTLGAKILISRFECSIFPCQYGGSVEKLEADNRLSQAGY